MKEENFSVHFIITGGTIDSYYDGSQDTVIPHKESVIPQFVKGLKLYCTTEFTTVCMKDSRDLQEADLESMLSAIENSRYNNIIVTHGTYTVADSARYVKEKLRRTDQTIIFTASLMPISGFAPSDGPFNLGFAIAAIKHLDPGTYVAINGRIFTPEEVVKEEVIKMVKDARFVSALDR